MKTILAMLLLTALALAQAATVIETSPSMPRPQNLGTRTYPPLPGERAFYERLPADERTTGSIFSDYSLAGHAGRFVGWLGIVRKIEGNTLTIEMRYFDGMTDTHQQVVSSHGGGDFKTVVNGSIHDIKRLSLVKVYGQVSDPLTITAQYIRVWDWGQFSFMPYGKERGNPQWRSQVDPDSPTIYDPAPTPAYYEKILGPR